MAEGGQCSDSDQNTVDIQIMDCSENEEDNFECVVPTQNRYEGGNGQHSGRGSGWQQVRRHKRKKVSSGSTGAIETTDAASFNTLSNDDKLSCLYELAFKNFHILNEVKSEQMTFYRTSKELKSSVDLLYKHVEKTERVTEYQTNCLKMLAYRSIDTEARSRRNNVIIWGVSEKSNSRLDDLILNFLEDEMSIDTTDMVIDRVHRLGSTTNMKNRHSPDPKRPIIARFRDYTDTEKVMKNAYKLKGTPFGIDRDYPREIALARKELYKSEEAKRARDNREKVQIRYPAKLYVNGRLVRDSLPEWHKYLSEDRLACFDQTQQINVIQNEGGLHCQQPVSVNAESSDDNDDSSEHEQTSSVFHRTTESDTSSESDRDHTIRSEQHRHAHLSNDEHSRQRKGIRNKSSRGESNMLNKTNLPLVNKKSSGNQRHQHQHNKIQVKNVNNNNVSRERASVKTAHTTCTHTDNTQQNSAGAINRQRGNPHKQQRDSDLYYTTRL